MSNIDYKLWPNAGGTLGENKVKIPTGTKNDPWPAGDALVGNFVYNKDGKLTGFVDTKALSLQRNYIKEQLADEENLLIKTDAVDITLPYDYVDLYLYNIQESTTEPTVNITYTHELPDSINNGELPPRTIKYRKYTMDDFDELDYLESSGTQNICIQTPNLTKTNRQIKQTVTMQFVSENNPNPKGQFGFIPRNGQAWFFGVETETNNSTSYVSASSAKINIIDVYEKHTITFTTQRADVTDDKPYQYISKSNLKIGNGNIGEINGEIVNDGEIGDVSYSPHVGGVTSSSPKNTTTGVDEEKYWKFGLFKCASVNRNPHEYPFKEGASGSVKIYSCEFEISAGDDTDGYVSKKYKLVPVLRKSDGTPGLFDIVNNFFYENVGDGTFGYRITGNTDPVAPKDDNPSTFSLRDPYYVAPSGVYAKLIAENTLEIVADTEEVQGDDWVHFANVSEAYSHFNIVLPIVE